jgi:PAS domain S-box-containing protein
VVAGLQAQQAVKDYAALLDLAHDAIIIHDDTGRITSWNCGAERAYGFDRADALGQVAHVLLRTEFPTTLDAIHSSLAETGRWEGELVHHTRDGNSVVDESLWVRSEIEGGLRGTLEICRDITERKETASELSIRAVELNRLNDALVTANRRLERSNHDLEQFAYAASHDLSEPLRAISGPIGLLARRYSGQLDAEADQFIDFAVDGCERMQKVIDGLLAYSRVGRSDGELNDAVDTALLFDAARVALGPAAADAHAAITAGALPIVVGSGVQLGQVFQNLLANAIKFRRSDVAPVIEVSATRTGDSWCFRVTDNGIGIDEHQRVRVFGMFKRLHTRNQYPGTGIGLALCQNIVERHGGGIGIEQAPSGAGTCVWFTLAAAPDIAIGMAS